MLTVELESAPRSIELYWDECDVDEEIVLARGVSLREGQHDEGSGWVADPMNNVMTVLCIRLFTKDE